MSSANRYNDLLFRAAWFFLGGAVVVALFFFRAYTFLPALSYGESHQIPLAPKWPQFPSLASHDWSIFQGRGGVITMDGGSLAKRFRLAGTFFAYGVGISGNRKAILDDLDPGIQHVVSENENIGDVRVVRIFQDRIVLHGPVGEEQLWLSFSRPRGRGTSGSGVFSGGTDGRDSVIEYTDRFGGKRMGEHRWLFKREPLLNYYQELGDEPQRLVNVFDSLKPVYDGADKITGYQLGVEGEAEFFRSAGLRQGDIVRRVNSVAMTNRRRAEHFINEFIQDRANVFVLDVERNGEVTKLIYQIR